MTEPGAVVGLPLDREAVEIIVELLDGMERTSQWDYAPAELEYRTRLTERAENWLRGHDSSY